MKIKLTMIILFFGLLFFVANLGPVEAAWADPSCAPPSCNRPEPITVEGGTIQSGYSLIVEGTDANTVVDNSGIKSGGKIIADAQTANYITQNLEVMECNWVAIDIVTDPLFPGYTDCQLVPLAKVENVFLNDLAIANQGVLLGEGQAIYGITGENSIQVSEGLGGNWGYGVLSQAHPVGITEASDDTVGVWGKAAVSVDNDNSYGIYGQGAGDNTYGVYATNISGNSYALRASNSYRGGGAAFFSGNVDIVNGDLNVNNGTVLGYLSSYGGDQNVLNVEGDTTINIDHYYKPRITIGTHQYGPYSYERDFKVTSTYADGRGRGPDYTPIRVRSTQPNKVYFGEVADSGIEICLNASCISSWPTGGGGGGGNKAFKTIDTPTGSNPVADSGADTLTLYEGDNISVTGNSSNDSITFAVDNDLTNISSITGTSGTQLVINPDDTKGTLIYDNLYVDDLGSNCDKVTTDSSGKLTCETDQVDDADNDANNEIQDLDSVLSEGASSNRTITASEICLGTRNPVCLTATDLQSLLDTLK